MNQSVLYKLEDQEQFLFLLEDAEVKRRGKSIAEKEEKKPLLFLTPLT